MDKIPILQMGRLLLVTIQVDMHDRLALQLQDDLTCRIAQTGAWEVLIDISSLEVVDSFIGRMLGQIAATIVHLGVDLSSVITKANLADAFAVALSRVGLVVRPAAARP